MGIGSCWLNHPTTSQCNSPPRNRLKVTQSHRDDTLIVRQSVGTSFAGRFYCLFLILWQKKTARGAKVHSRLMVLRGVAHYLRGENDCWRVRNAKNGIRHLLTFAGMLESNKNNGTFFRFCFMSFRINDSLPPHVVWVVKSWWMTWWRCCSRNALFVIPAETAGIISRGIFTTESVIWWGNIKWWFKNR